MSNTGAQTVFLMPNGDMVMPNYDEFNNIEFMQKFGNILKQSFEKLVKPIIKSENSFMLVECSSYIPVLSFLIFF
jgi:hypothetical protein